MWYSTSAIFRTIPEMEFLIALSEHLFLQYAIAAGVLASISCGITGTFVVVKRIGFISGGIAHTALGGLGVAFYFGINPMIGALLSAILAAVIIGFVTIKVEEQADTVIGALWAVGMATGLIFMSATPGYNVNLVSYLFGNILMVSRTDLYMLLTLNIVIIIIVFIFYRQFVLISFDEVYSKLRGLKVNLVYILLLCIIALTVVLLIQVVGLILVIALLTLPAAISRIYFNKMSRIMISAIFLGLLFTISGLVFSYYGRNLPAGATIIIVAGTVYLISAGIKSFAKKSF
jgi:zinc transport system permease protein